jgi:hypothetical protein
MPTIPPDQRYLFIPIRRYMTAIELQGFHISNYKN